MGDGVGSRCRDVVAEGSEIVRGNKKPDPPLQVGDVDVLQRVRERKL